MADDRTDWMRPTDGEYGPWERAGRVVRTRDGTLVSDPPEAVLRDAGYLPPAKNGPPETDDKHMAVAVGWKAEGGYAVRVYEVQKLPPRTFDKYKLVDALITAGVWDQVEAWLKETPYAWLRVQMTPDISEDEPLLAQGIAAVKELLGWTDAQVEEILKEASI